MTTMTGTEGQGGASTDRRAYRRSQLCVELAGIDFVVERGCWSTRLIGDMVFSECAFKRKAGLEMGLLGFQIGPVSGPESMWGV